jgi:urea ABC transporter permease protein UrtB
MEEFVPVVLNALTYISILILVAIGLAIVFGMMDIVNLAHGEFITIGAYTVAIVQRLNGMESARSTYWIGLLLAPIVGAIVGLVLEATVIRPLYRRTLDTLLATYAVSLILQKSIELMFGALPQVVVSPMPNVVGILGAEYPAFRLFIIALAVVLIVAILLVFSFTRFGVDLRAVIQNSAMAEAVGINTKRLNRLAFATGAGLAALAGALIAPLASVEAHLGVFYLGKAFFVIALGGIGSIFGSIAGSAFIGTAETLLNYQINPSFASALVLALAIVIIRFRPQGLIPGFSGAHQLLGKG